MRPRPAVVERLEARQFLSGTLVTECPLEPQAPTPLTPAVGTPLKPAVRAAATSAPVAERFVGVFRGSGASSNPFDLQFFDMDVVVTAVTATGFVGSVTTNTNVFGGGNRREVAGTFVGKLKPRGAFAYRLIEPGRRVSFKGRLILKTDRLVGKLRMKIGPGTNMPRGDVGGTFRLDRVSPAPPAPATSAAAE